MLDTVVKIVGIVVTSISTIVRVVDIFLKLKEKHQKSNRQLARVNGC